MLAANLDGCILKYNYVNVLGVDWRYIACLYAGYDPRRVKDISIDGDSLAFLNTVPQISSEDSKNVLSILNETEPENVHLFSMYRELNEEGQEKLVDYAEDLVAGGRYIKSDEAVVGKEA